MTEKENPGNIKSAEIQLRKRGWINSTDLEKIFFCSDNELFLLINSGLATERTASVRLLSERKGINDELTDLLLKKLQKEPCLYTRLEICIFLEKGDEHIARKMIAYLGKIGKNQYKKLPEKVSGKSSYPLPRDIIARSLARMDVSIMPVLLETLKVGETDVVSEAIDAIGFMAFYNQKVATVDNLTFLVQTMEKYVDYPVILWKCITAFSAFPFDKIVDILKNVAENRQEKIFKEEAKRSAKLIQKRIENRIVTQG